MVIPARNDAEALTRALDRLASLAHISGPQPLAGEQVTGVPLRGCGL